MGWIITKGSSPGTVFVMGTASVHHGLLAPLPEYLFMPPVKPFQACIGGEKTRALSHAETELLSGGCAADTGEGVPAHKVGP